MIPSRQQLLLHVLTAGVSVLAQHPAIEGAGVDAETFGHQVTEAGGVQVGAAADDTVLGQAAQLPGDVGQHVDCGGGGYTRRSLMSVIHPHSSSR